MGARRRPVPQHHFEPAGGERLGHDQVHGLHDAGAADGAMICASTELKATLKGRESACVPCRAGTATCARGGCRREMADQLVTAQLLGRSDATVRAQVLGRAQ